MSVRIRHCAASAALALAAAGGVGEAAAGAQMFKCVEGGRTVYQQQACSVSSQPEPLASVAPKASAAADPASAGARKVKRASPAASSAPATPR